MAHLVAIDGPATGLVLELRGALLVLGRDPTADLVVPDDAASRHHCRLVADGATWKLADLGSLNPTLVNGRPADESILEDGDDIRVGATTLRFVASPGELVAGGRGGVTRRIDVDALTSHGAADRLEDILALGERLARAAGAADVLDELAGWLTSATGGTQVCVYRTDQQRMRLVLERGTTTSSGSLVVDADAMAQIRAGATLWLADPGLLLAPVGGGTAHYLAVIRCATEPPAPLLRMVTCAVRLAGGAVATAERIAAQPEVELADAPLASRSPAMQPVIRFIERASGSDATALILGESGTGKELVVRAIHRLSHRSPGPLVVVNCAALPETLMEAELFGHERGAFTGATETRAGRFERAHRGTLVLDEIGELSPGAQARLLRVLEERIVERLGGDKPIRVDVRVMAATHRDLARLCEQGRFRDDLYYRLSVLSVTVPPLRDRREDLAALAEWWLEHAAARGPRRVAGFTNEAMAALSSYPWPGNVRELRNAIEHAVVMGNGDQVAVDDLPPHLVGARSQPGGELRLPASLLDVERAAVAAAMTAAGGNKAKAARILGIERATLYTKLRLHGLDRDE